MSILGLEETPIGPIGRGFERTTKHGRTFDRWEVHYENVYHPVVMVLPVNEIPPEQKLWDGRMVYRIKADLDHRQVWYNTEKLEDILASL